MAAVLLYRTYISDKLVEKLRDSFLNRLVDNPTHFTMHYVREKYISTFT
jgi:hypothetical protein